jgi:RNA-directed DNA polymerase
MKESFWGSAMDSAPDADKRLLHLIERMLKSGVECRGGEAKDGGEVYIVRYADDSVLGFQYRSDGERFLEAFKDRLAKFGLSQNEEKTRLIEFGQFADSNRRGRGEGKPEVFEFLGFTNLCSKRRSDGGYKLQRQINAKRQRSKLRQIKETLMRTRYRHP